MKTTNKLNAYWVTKMLCRWKCGCWWNPLNAQHIKQPFCVSCVLMAGGGMGSMSMDRMGSSLDRMAMSGMDMNRSFSGYGQMGGGLSDRGSGSKAGCQIFVRNVGLALNTFMTTQAVITILMTETVHKRWKVYTQEFRMVILLQYILVHLFVWPTQLGHTFSHTFIHTHTRIYAYVCVYVYVFCQILHSQ